MSSCPITSLLVLLEPSNKSGIVKMKKEKKEDKEEKEEERQKKGKKLFSELKIICFNNLWTFVLIFNKWIAMVQMYYPHLLQIISALLYLLFIQEKSCYQWHQTSQSSHLVLVPIKLPFRQSGHLENGLNNRITVLSAKSKVNNQDCLNISPSLTKPQFLP